MHRVERAMPPSTNVASPILCLVTPNETFPLLFHRVFFIVCVLFHRAEWNRGADFVLAESLGAVRSRAVCADFSVWEFDGAVRTVVLIIIRYGSVQFEIVRCDAWRCGKKWPNTAPYRTI